MIVNYYFFNDNKKSRRMIQRLMKYIIFMNVNYTNVNLIL